MPGIILLTITRPRIRMQFVDATTGTSDTALRGGRSTLVTGDEERRRPAPASVSGNEISNIL